MDHFFRFKFKITCQDRVVEIYQDDYCIIVGFKVDDSISIQQVIQNPIQEKLFE